MTDTILITGASGGLGLATAEAAASDGAHVLCGGRDLESTQQTADRVGGTPTVFDLASLRSVREAAADLPHVDAVACVAGLQTLHRPTATADGFEQTFQVNHLSHLVLADALLERPEPPRRLVFVGSGTHDPSIRTGTPDPIEGDVASMARADAADRNDDERTDGLRRYTTSKMLAIAAALGLAREHPESRITAFDPGLMPGTGLARDYPAPLRLLWNSILKGLTILPFASSPSTSGKALARLLAAKSSLPSGRYVDYRLKPLEPSKRAGDRGFQEAVLRESRELVAPGGV